jgi:hypothetical protein
MSFAMSFMYGVKRLGLLARHLNPLLRNDTQSRLFNHGVDQAGDISPRGIGLQYRKRSLNCHRIPSFQ